MRLPSKAELTAAFKSGGTGWAKDWYWTKEILSDKQAVRVDMSTGRVEGFEINLFKTSQVRCHSK